MGGGRDIPPGANFHRSVVDRITMRGDPKLPEYKPINDLFMRDSAGNVKTSSNDKLHMVKRSDGTGSAALRSSFAA